MNPISHFENCKLKSNYHFDGKIIDHRGEWFTVGGKLPNTWQEDLAKIKSDVYRPLWVHIPELIYQENLARQLETEATIPIIKLVAGVVFPPMPRFKIPDF